MASESFVEVTQGTGTKTHSLQRVIGVNTVEQSVVVRGEPYLASYLVTQGGSAGQSIATANTNLVQLLAGASLRVYLRRIRIYQRALATTAAICGFDVVRATTAGTGGTAVTPARRDTTDSASGASVLYGITSPGTLTTTVDASTVFIPQAVMGGQQNGLLVDLDYRGPGKALIIPAGTANGIVVRNRDAIAAATVVIVLDFDEANF